MSETPTIGLAALTELDVDGVRILWINDWYDGPLESVVEHQGENHLMLVHELIDDSPWRWVLYRLSPEQWAEEEHWHRLFLEHVGAHWDCIGATHPAPSGHPERFYTPYEQRTPRDTATLQPIGWLSAMPSPKRPGPLR